MTECGDRSEYKWFFLNTNILSNIPLTARPNLSEEKILTKWSNTKLKRLILCIFYFKVQVASSCFLSLNPPVILQIKLTRFKVWKSRRNIFILFCMKLITPIKANIIDVINVKMVHMRYLQVPLQVYIIEMVFRSIWPGSESGCLNWLEVSSLVHFFQTLKKYFFHPPAKFHPISQTHTHPIFHPNLTRTHMLTHSVRELQILFWLWKEFSSWKAPPTFSRGRTKHMSGLLGNLTNIALCRYLQQLTLGLQK